MFNVKQVRIIKSGGSMKILLKTSNISLSVCLFLISLCMFACIKHPKQNAESNADTITVESGINTGALMWGSIGWLYGLGENTKPADSMITGLVHPQYTYQKAPFGTQHGDGDALKVAIQAKRTGMKGVGIYVQDYYTQWPYPNNGIDSYITDVVDKVCGYVLADANRSFMVYVPFNEPDWIWYGTSLSQINSFCTDWEKVYNVIKSKDPEAKIVGPNIMAYNSTFMNTFFTFCKNNNCMPDIASWHALDNDFFNNWYNYYADFRKINDSIPVHINEYGRQSVNGKCDIQVPGRLVQFITRFENSKVFACEAFWTGIGTQNDACTSDGKPTGTWYLYQWYGQMTGNSVKVSLPNSNGPLQAFASKNNNSVKVIFGGSLNDTDVYHLTIVVKGLSGSSASYKVLETKYTGQSAAPTPSMKTSGTVIVSGGSISVNVAGCAALSAYNLQIN